MKGMRESIRVALAAAGLVLASCGGEEAEEKGADSPSDTETRGLVGGNAPDFSVVAVSGAKGKITLKKLRGKVVIVDFWGTFCEPCKKSFPKLQELNDKYADSGLQIVAISEDEADDKDKIRGFAEEFGAKFIIGWDADKSVAKHYSPTTMPSSFVIDRKGRVRFAHAGYHDGDDVQIDKEIAKLLDQ
jgi:cytochrome c biogenesis protein CcmG, thiol:disulfide interchange protein DsbE